MLPRINRLSKQKDFRAIWRQKTSDQSQDLIIKKNPNQKVNSRFAVVVSSKVIKRAVKRNRLRRQLFEILRHNLQWIKTGYDVMIILRADLTGYKIKELENLIIDCLRRNKIYIKS